MAQRALPEREARLGRPHGAVGQAPHAVVLVLPGDSGGALRGSALAAAAALPLARRLGRASSRDDPLAAHVVHYRSPAHRDGTAGRTAEETVPAGAVPAAADSRTEHGGCAYAEDAEWAVEEVVRRYGDVPVCLVGRGVGGRAALRAAGHSAVVSVVALGPVLECADGADGAEEAEPVRHLRGRHVLLVHGTNDARSDPELSFRFAERAKKINAQVCRFEVHTDGHGLRGYAAEVAALTRDFVLGTLCARDLCRPLTDALAAPPPLGLRMPLASGFGKSLR
ncbi:alpha/beta hydrolase family protein [Streptomyces sp. PU-14G]|uniref:alpha/beta hydrolase family protein n=1 Tax=Streptomyces sp. PU-14G TaxID=2800808 RepID=UPI0034E0368F